MFGYTLMTAGLTRIIEICFFPSPSTFQPVGMVVSTTDDDINSDHTLQDERPALQHSKKDKTIWSFRHLPPLVRIIIFEVVSLAYSHVVTCLSWVGVIFEYLCKH